MIELSSSSASTSAAPVSRAERRRTLRASQKSSQEELRQVLYEHGVLALGHEAGQRALEALMEEDACRQCGVDRKGKHKARRTGYRNGYEAGVVFLGGQQVRVLRPRVVGTEGGELPIESYQSARDPEFLNRAALVACALGVSQRRYEEVVRSAAPLGGDPDRQGGLSRSAVGRRFMAAADQKVKELLSRRLDDRFLVVWLDGVGEGGFLAVAAVGLTDKGEKKVLGLRQGSTEDVGLCREFLHDLCGRGLSAETGLLCVIDGGKGMACALREVFGSKVAIQRCRIHKKRNILAKIPASERAAVEAQLESAWKGNDEILCRARLELLARGLEARGRREAAASVREGLRESLTCTRLAIPVGLHASLMNTNVIESAFSQHESTAHRVKRWQNGQQLVRWVGIALQRAEQSFASVADPDLLRRLSEAMDNFAAGSVAQPQRVGKQAPARSQVEHLRPPSLAA